MSSYTKYRLVRQFLAKDEDYGCFESAVEDKLDGGYKLYGPPSVTRTDDSGSPLIIQAMVGEVYIDED